MKRRLRTIRWIPVILACLFVLVLYGCEGNDARKSVTGTVRDFLGQKSIEQGDRMKQDIDRAVKEEARRLLKMDEGNTGESPPKIGGEEGEEGTGE